jgi:hypothetical protein
MAVTLIVCVGNQIAPECADAIDEILGNQGKQQYRFVMREWIADDQLGQAKVLWVVDDRVPAHVVLCGLQNKIPLLVPEQSTVLKDLCSTANCGLYFLDSQDAAACLQYLTNNEEVCDSIGKSGQRFLCGLL